MELTENMKKALMQVGYGVSYRNIPGTQRMGFFDEEDKKVDGRSLDALARRGLIYSYSSGGAPLVTALRLTPEGEFIFECLRKEGE